MADRPAAIEFYGGYEVYDENGIDLTCLRHNLALPLEERVENNRRGAASIESIRQELGFAQQRAFRFDVAVVLKTLNHHHVEYVVIGGIALVVHGSNYSTNDLDICCSRTPQNLSALAAALTALHACQRGASSDQLRFDAIETLVLQTDDGDLDIFGIVSGIGDYSQVSAKAQVMKLWEMDVQVLSIDGLIATKKATGRRQDRLHLLELEALKKLMSATE